MKSLFFVTNGHPQMELIAESITSYALLGDDVTVVECSERIGQCLWNMDRDKRVCWLCKKHFNYLKRKMPKNVLYTRIEEFDSDNEYDVIKKIRFEYNSVDDIKQLSYNGINIGYGTLSTYISATRNLDPEISSVEFREYIDEFLNRVCYQTYLQEKIILSKQPDRIIFFNGRVSNVRTLVEIAQKHKIQYVVLETIVTLGEKFCVDNYYNYMPHSLKNTFDLMNSYWNDISVSEQDKKWLGAMFYEGKQNGKYVGDKFYVKDQIGDKLPDNWDNGKKKYVIFNSSEDEFFSIGDEYDKEKVFSNQIEGIEYICKFLEHNADIDIYLRIHPNLREIRYKYHLDLLNLETKYKNIKVIPADSKISSYVLMRNADKVIVFGSTMGVEASYAGKPVINLAGAVYKKLNVTYNPSTIEELEKLLEKQDLQSIKDMDGLLKFGYYYQRQNHIMPKFIEVDVEKHKFLGKEITLFPTKFCGSKFLYFILVCIINKLRNLKSIPTKERNS